jgi:predicted AAA+ superfamily ATPase
MIHRSVLEEIKQHLVEPEITLITGARQVGKTTLMNMLLEELQKKGEKVLFLSLDFESDIPFFSTQQALINRINLEFGDQSGFVFLDEIQRKENAGLYLKGLYDMKLPVKFIISGSGSIELKETIAESLAGRKRLFEITPVTFNEFLDFRTQYRFSGKLPAFTQAYPDKTQELFYEYLNFGGYPRVITASTIKEKVLQINEIFHSYIDRDIRHLISGDQPEAFVRVVRLLAAQTGQMLNLNNLSNDARVSVSTLQKHLWIAQKTFFIKLVEPYFKNVTKEITKSPVVYFADHGIRNFSISNFGNVQRHQDYGFVFQNLVGNELLHKLYATPFSVHYWRTTDKAEVDFVISRMHNPIGVEVKCAPLKTPVITRSLRSFIEKYKPTEAWVVNLTYTGSTMVGTTKIRHITFFELPDIIHELVSSIERSYMAEERRFPYRYSGSTSLKQQISSPAD